MNDVAKAVNCYVCGLPFRFPIKVLKIRSVLSQDQEEKDYLAGAQVESDSESEGESDKLNVTFTMSDLKVCIIGNWCCLHCLKLVCSLLLYYGTCLLRSLIQSPKAEGDRRLEVSSVQY